MLPSILDDLRHALRGMRRAPGFTALVLGTLTLGIGATVAIFSVVRGVLLEPLPYASPDELVRVQMLEPYRSVSEPEFADFRREARSFANLAVWRRERSALTGGGADAERVEVARVSDGFFGVLRTPPLLGRSFTAEEEAPGGGNVVILSHALWQRRYGSDRAIVGRQLTVDGKSFAVIGVMPQRFRSPEERIAMWVPLRLRYDSLWERNNHYLSMLARLAPGVGVGQAQEELLALGRRFTRDFPQYYTANAPLRPTVQLLGESMVGRARPYLVALLGAVAFVLLIACVNVAGLLLARGEARRRELAVRTALGASRRRLTRQVLTEAVLQAVVGGSFGVALAWWGVRVVQRFAPADLPRVTEIRVDGTVLAFAALVTLATGLLFGTWPALRASHGDTVGTLRDGGRGASGTSRWAGRARRRLAVAEMALAVVTLTGAGLMLRSLGLLQSVDLGFRTDGALTMQVSLPPTTYAGERAVSFYARLEERLRALPGVRHVGAVQDLPVGDGYSSLSILVDGAPPTTTALAPTATPMIVTPDYFRAMGISLKRGRFLSAQDVTDGPLVIVVNEAMVREHWAARDPLGATVRMFGLEGRWATVVGVVNDVRLAGFAAPSAPTIYYPYAQAGRSAYYTPTRMSLVVRTDGDPTALAGPAREIVRALEGDAPVSRVQTMAQVVAASVATRRLATRLLAVFALLALGLAAVGLYGVIAQSVEQRRGEMGVRMALGARRSQVLGLVLGEGMRTAALGGMIGAAASLGLVRLLRAATADLAPWDSPTLAMVLATMLVVALGAAFVPAHRASRIDPMPALRE